jgi:hypothetical protein
LRANALAEAEKAFEAALARSSKDKEGADTLGALAGLTEAQLRLNKLEAAKANSERLLAAAPKSRIAKLLSAQVATSGVTWGVPVSCSRAVSANPDDLRPGCCWSHQPGRAILARLRVHFATVSARQPDNIRAQQLLVERAAAVHRRSRTQDAQAGAGTAARMLRFLHWQTA